MPSRCGHRYRFIISLPLALFASPALAIPDLSSWADPSRVIITLGFAGFGLLALFVAILAVTFLIKALKESARARKEEKSHAPKVNKDGSLGLSFVTWIGGAFMLLAVGTIFIVFLFVLSGADMSPTKSMGSLIVEIGFAGFALLVLYLAAFPLFSLFKPKPQVEKPVETAPAADATALPLNPEMTRRSFISLLGWAWIAFTAATMGALSTVLRFFFPNVTFEPPLKFKAGFPDTYSVGVDERYKETHRVWIVRNTQGFYALSTICTHLGCTPNWLQADQKFKCPCHGSGFYVTGINFEGPAPRPLPRFNIVLADDGQIQIDEAVQYQYELGQWGLPGSFLDYKV